MRQSQTTAVGGVRFWPILTVYVQAESLGAAAIGSRRSVAHLRPNILILPEQVLRVVLRLDPR